MRFFNWIVAAGVTLGYAPFADQGLAAPVANDPNLVLWMRADSGVSGAAPVTKIADSSDNGNDMIGAGNPLLTTTTFPTGDRPVIRFGGAAAFYVPTTAALNLTDASIYIVATQLNGFFTAQCYVSNYGPAFKGYAVGISDTERNTIKFYTSRGDFQSSLEPFTVPDETPFMLTTTFATDGGNANKTAYLDGGDAFTEVGANPTYAASNQFVIAGLDPDGTAGVPGQGYNQLVIGDIAEILIYNNVDDAQRADVETYLKYKYFVNPPTGSADFNGDLSVDGADFLTWQRGFGSGTTLSQGDADGDHDVDGDDLAIFDFQFGTTSSAPIGTTVPEPATCILAGCGLVAAFGTDRYCRQRSCAG